MAKQISTSSTKSKDGASEYKYKEEEDKIGQILLEYKVDSETGKLTKNINYYLEKELTDEISIETTTEGIAVYFEKTKNMHVIKTKDQTKGLKYGVLYGGHVDEYNEEDLQEIKRQIGVDDSYNIKCEKISFLNEDGEPCDFGHIILEDGSWFHVDRSEEDGEWLIWDMEVPGVIEEEKFICTLQEYEGYVILKLTDAGIMDYL